jgi:hypothetical protein
VGVGVPEGLVVGALGYSEHGGAVGPYFWEFLPFVWVGTGEALSS